MHEWRNRSVCCQVDRIESVQSEFSQELYTPMAGGYDVAVTNSSWSMLGEGKIQHKEGCMLKVSIEVEREASSQDGCGAAHQYQQRLLLQ